MLLVKSEAKRLKKFPKFRVRFAYMPTELEDRSVVWLEKYSELTYYEPYIGLVHHRTRRK